MDHSNVRQRIDKIFGKRSGNFNVIEEQIDLKIQMDFFEHASKIKHNKASKDALIARREELFEDTISNEEKKELLSTLAGVNDVSVFRALEKFSKNKESELYEWSLLALHENRMLLESSLLNQNQVFISTGLGGRGNKLRYFIVLTSRKRKELNDIQKKIIRSEFEFIFEKEKSILEDVSFGSFFACATSLIPINANIKDILKKVVGECNQLGNFLSTNFIVTNVKVLTIEEIEELLTKTKTGRIRNM